LDAPPEPPEVEALPKQVGNPPMNSHRPLSQTIKVDSGRVEMILNVVGELVVIKSQLVNEALKLTGNLRLNAVVSLLDKTIRELQDRTLGMRLTPLKSLF